MELALTGIVGIVGNYGSGKTEVAVNLAVNRKQAGLDVCLADLDLVNPYFYLMKNQQTIGTILTCLIRVHVYYFSSISVAIDDI